VKPSRATGGGTPQLPGWPLLAVLCLLPQVAQAHPTGGEPGGFLAGLAHPFGGADHLLAILAVGLWAAQLGGRAVVAIPCWFIGLMVLGGAVACHGQPLPGVEQAIAASVLVFGVVIATAARLPWSWAALVVGLFAVCHGHAHGAEMPSAADRIAFTSGFVVATATLLAAGIGIGGLARSLGRAAFVRLAGAAIGLGGACLVLG